MIKEGIGPDDEEFQTQMQIARFILDKEYEVLAELDRRIGLGAATMINHPKHYFGEDSPVEPIKLIEKYHLDFHYGNALKYVLRSKFKGNELQDLEKAKWYINRAKTLPWLKRHARSAYANLFSDSVAIDVENCILEIAAQKQDQYEYFRAKNKYGSLIRSILTFGNPDKIIDKLEHILTYARKGL